MTIITVNMLHNIASPGNTSQSSPTQQSEGSSAMVMKHLDISTTIDKVSAQSLPTSTSFLEKTIATQQIFTPLSAHFTFFETVSVATSTILSSPITSPAADLPLLAKLLREVQESQHFQIQVLF